MIGETTEMEARARAWQDSALAAVCDVLEPWEHGLIARATPYPRYFSFNLVRVFDDPGMSAEELAAVADEALAGLAHRRVDFDDVAAGDARRSDFEALGYRSERIVWMRHDNPGAAPAAQVAVEVVPYESVEHLRAIWVAGGGVPEPDAAAFCAQRREVARRRAAQVLGLREDGEIVAYAQVERAGTSGEIEQVFVAPQCRGRGLGTAVTCAAIKAVGEVEDLWICADDEDRPKQLYARLGFRAAWTAMEFCRVDRAS
jgi:ribosomal protein S18 acetylase RimI-like enzyme